MSTVKQAVGYVCRAVKQAGVTVLTPEALYKALTNVDALEKQETSLLFCGLFDLLVSVYYYGGKLEDPAAQLQKFTTEYRKSPKGRPTATDFAKMMEHALTDMGFVYSLTKGHVRSLDMCRTVADFDYGVLAAAICYVTVVSRLLHMVILDSISASSIHVCAESLKKEGEKEAVEECSIMGNTGRRMIANVNLGVTAAPGVGIPYNSMTKSRSQQQGPQGRTRSALSSSAAATGAPGSQGRSVANIFSEIHETIESIRRLSCRINLLLPRWSCDVSEALHPAEIADIMDGKKMYTDIDRSRNALLARKQTNSLECLQRIATANDIINTVINMVQRSIADREFPLREGEIYRKDSLVAEQTLGRLLSTAYFSADVPANPNTNAGTFTCSNSLLPFVKGSEKYHESLQDYIQQHAKKHKEAQRTMSIAYNNICKSINDLMVTVNNVSLRRLRDFSALTPNQKIHRKIKQTN